MIMKVYKKVKKCILEKYKKVKEWISDDFNKTLIVAIGSLIYLSATIHVTYPIIKSLLLWVVNIDNLNTEFSKSLISTSFTILGFSITVRNIIISRDLQRYTNFTFKTLIYEATSIKCKFAWYLIILIPGYSLILYSIGFRRQFYVLTFISVVCMLYYFYNSLKRLDNTVLRKTIVDLFIENMIDKSNDVDSNRKELFSKLCSENELEVFSVEQRSIFKLFYNEIHNIVKMDGYEGMKRRYNYPRIELSIKDSVDYDKNLIKDIALKSSIYTYSYFDCTLKNIFLKKTYTEEKIDEVKKFVPEYFNMVLEKYIDNGLEIKNNNLQDKEYLIFVNTLFGIILSCLNNLSFIDNKELINDIYETLANREELVYTQIVPHFCAMIIVSINYLLVNNTSFLDTTSSYDILEFYKKYQSFTIDTDYSDLYKLIYNRFHIEDEIITMGKVIKEIANNQKGYFNPIPDL